MSKNNHRSQLRAACTSENLRNRLDQYGQSFFLSFKGKQTFNTNLGAIVSIVVYINFLVYVIYKGQILVRKLDTSTITNQYAQKENYTDPEMINYQDYRFDIAFKEFPALPPEFGSFKVYYRQEFRNLETSVISEFYVTELEYDVCGQDFNYDDQEEVAFKSFDEFYCLKNMSENSKFIGGTSYAAEFDYILLQFERCVNQTDSDIVCASIEAQNEAHQNTKLQIILVDNYFDYNDLDKPVKSFLEQKFYIYLDSYYFIQSILEMIPCVAYTSYSLFPFSSPEQINFAKLDPPQTQRIAPGAKSNSANLKFNMFFKLSNQRIEIQSSIYSVLDFLSDIGGLFSTFFVIGKLVVGFYLESLFYSHIIQNLFQVDLRDEKLQNIENREEKRVKQANKSEMVTNYLKQDNTNQDEKEEFQNQLTNEILARRSFNYTLKDIIKSQISVLLCCCRKPRTIQANQQLRKKILFKKAVRRIENQFDALNMFAVMKQFKLLSKIIFSKPQKFILKFQRNQVLNSDSSSLESEGYIENIENLNSSNPYSRLRFLAKIQGISRRFLTQGKRKGLDKRLLKGVFNKKKQNKQQKIPKSVIMQAVESFFQNKIHPKTEEEKQNSYEEAKQQNTTRIDQNTNDIFQDYLDFVADEGIVGVLGLRKDIDLKNLRSN